MSEGLCLRTTEGFGFFLRADSLESSGNRLYLCRRRKHFQSTEARMEKKSAVTSGRTSHSLAKRRRTSAASGLQADAYLAAKETLRRIARSSHVAALTAGAVTIHWTPGA